MIVSVLSGSPMRRGTRLIACMAALLTFTACGGATGDDGVPDESALDPARDALTSAGIMRHIQVLSDDSLEGRAPGTPGEEKTVRYLVEQFEALGLAPGNPDGTYVQNVELVGIASRFTTDITRDGVTTRWQSPRDYVVRTRYAVPSVSVDNSELVFVGYGVVAPEYDWNDYKDVDVTGKTIVMLVNDPAVPAPDGEGLDPALFKGDAMTYYGRWTYKYEIASARGAAAAIIVHETGPAGYPYEVISSGGELENFDVNVPGGPVGRVKAEGWMARETAESLFADAGLNFDSLKTLAATRDFRPVSLGATADIRLTNTFREVQSRNVVAKLEGNDPALKDEWVLYTAHWDHLGRDTTLTGDQIYNGALDNASGTAALLEIAGAMAKLPERSPRSMLFVALTAEEQGLLGAKWYAEQPLYPLDKTLAVINMDILNQWGRTRDLTVVGLGNSSLDDVLREVMARDDRTLAPDPEPEKGFFFRSDHFEFAKKGVPALYIESGVDYVDRAPGFGQMKRDEYTENDYHKVSDEIKADWDLSGGVADARALLEVGWRIAHMRNWPTWSATAEFKAARDSSLKAAAPDKK